MLPRQALRALSFLGFGLAVQAADLRISGPYTHDNLSIYLIHSSAKTGSRKLLTLQEALDQKKVAVYETGQVNELAIENQSSEEVFIQSGDIVKGGQQDRVLSTDLVLPPHSGRMPIGSFCVEHNRWTQRGSESAAQFSASNAALPSKSLKLAVREEKDQSKVWNQVAVMQDKLKPVAGAPPASSSMQLTLENNRVTRATGGYVAQLAAIIDGKPDVVGYAYAINGKLNSADVYASPELFRKMWRKMLEASATEAASERQTGEASTAPAATAVKAALEPADQAKEASRENAGRLTVTKRDSGKVLVFDARESDSPSESIHKSYVVK
jgi:hypothetical protein